MGDLNESPDKSMSPSLQISSGSGTRYPNQFFDLAQQYMPPTIKELFRWCTFYYYNSPLIGSSITKISRYPITDMIFEDEHDSVRDLWQKIFVKELKMKDQLMEINLDYHVYGNAFVSVHLPFTRFLVCPSCKHREPIQQWNWTFEAGSYGFRGVCRKCKTSGNVEVHDVPYKDRKSIRLIRWNPENIYVKYNEYTGRRIYMYSVPYRLRTAIQRGDRDVLEDIPIIVLQALRNRRMIRFNNDNFRHLRRPTLAEQDQGWGKPLILHVLKDMFYLYTLRRSQEAIAMEHIVPFDLIYPMPNAQQDPYIHTNLANWRVQIETVIRKHRRDPNFKAVIPIPVGFGRLGGDGKAMMLTPELNYLTQTIVGGMGIPQEFLFGGLNFTGSSISLRTLENDFIQNRSQLLDLVLWLKDKIRIWLNLPDLKNIRFADFRMADDVQKNQQLIGLNAQMKVSDQTMLTELGYDWEQEQRKMIEEAQFQNYLQDLRAKANAKTQGESMLITNNYQQKINDMAMEAQANNEARAAEMGIQGAGQVPAGQGADPGGEVQMGDGAEAAGAPQMTAAWQDKAQSSLGGNAAGGGGQMPNGNGKPAVGEVEQEVNSRVQRWAKKLTTLDPGSASETLMELKSKMPDIGLAVEKEYKTLLAGVSKPGAGGQQKNQVRALPQKQAPRAGGGLV